MHHVQKLVRINRTLKQIPHLNELTKVLDVVIVVSFRKVMMVIRHTQEDMYAVWYIV